MSYKIFQLVMQKQRYFIHLCYKGTNYSGWQIQPNATTIQGELEQSLSTILNESIHLIGAGRTDAGVHAKSFYAHFEANADNLKEKKHTIFRINNYLPRAIAIYDIFPVHNNAHARFDAISRIYDYTIIQKKDPFLDEYAYFLPYPLNIEKMNKAAEILCKEKDFQSFAKLHSSTKTFICNLQYARWEKSGNIIKFSICADRFLRNMVRAIVGTIIEIGKERITMDTLKKIIKSKNRSEAGYSVPAKGLTLIDIEYPSDLIKLRQT